MELNNQKKILENLINNGEKDIAVQMLTEWALQSSFKDVIFNILEPLLIEWGKLWMEVKLSLAHGYLSGKIAEEFYLIASRDESFNATLLQVKGTVVLGNIEDDFHPLGRRLVHIFSQTAGWKIIDLGNDVPAELFIENAIEYNADIIGVSAMMFTTARNILKVRNLIDKQGLSGKIKLAVGGAVFKLRPELVSEIGGDGTAETAIDAPGLFENLLRIKNQDVK